MKSKGLAVVVTAVLAACGSDDGGSSTATDPTEAPTTAAHDDGSVETTSEDTAVDLPTSATSATTMPSTTEVPSTTADASAETDPAGARPDPCSLWTAADLESATGLSFLAGEFNTQLSVNGQEICDWFTSGDTIANAQVLVLAPGLDYAFLRSGTEVAAGPVTDFELPGADAAHISADERIIGADFGGVVVQLAYLPPAGVSGTGDQLRALAEIAAVRAAGGDPS